jgi:hypothetical protein
MFVRTVWRIRIDGQHRLLELVHNIEDGSGVVYVDQGARQIFGARVAPTSSDFAFEINGRECIVRIQLTAEQWYRYECEVNGTVLVADSDRSATLGSKAIKILAWITVVLGAGIVLFGAIEHDSGVHMRLKCTDNATSSTSFFTRAYGKYRVGVEWIAPRPIYDAHTPSQKITVHVEVFDTANTRVAAEDFNLSMTRNDIKDANGDVKYYSDDDLNLVAHHWYKMVVHVTASAPSVSTPTDLHLWAGPDDSVSNEVMPWVWYAGGASVLLVGAIVWSISKSTIIDQNKTDIKKP